MLKKINSKIIILSLGIIIFLIIGILFFSQKRTVSLKNEQAQKSNEAGLPSGSPTSESSQIPDSQPVENMATENTANQNEKTDAQASNIQSASPSSNPSNSGISIKNNFVSWGFQESKGRKIDTIIIHNSYSTSGDPYSFNGILNEWKAYGVAPHYLIDRSGIIYQLVDEKNIAFHAGVSQTPDGRTNVNNFSIGIELMNTQTDKLTDAQYNALNELIKNIKTRYSIKYVLGHNQIAPGRKTDPWNFDWSRIDK